jgi:ATP-dependent Clp protease ATP-binding subunit ClpA
VRELGTQLAEKKVTITVTPAARAYLGKKGHDPMNGARPLGRLIQDEVKRPLTDELLFGKLAEGGAVEVDAREEKLVFNFPAAAPAAADPAAARS